MENNTRWKDIPFHYENPSEDYIIEQIIYFEDIVKQYCDISNIDFNKIRINEFALKDVIIRTDMRKLYFSIFHNGMIPNEHKLIVGLTVFWIIKRHPFILDVDVNTDNDELRFASQINERIALHITMTLLRDYNSDFFENGEDLMQSYAKELLYSFTYRDLSKESIFLMFDPFYFMYHLNKSFKDGNPIL